MSARTHELKCWPPFYEAVESGVKPFELRRNDRGFEVDDVLHLREWMNDYTGRECRRVVTYVLVDAETFGLAKGYCVLGVSGKEKT